MNHYDFLNEPFLDNLDEKAESEREQEADAFAGRYLNQDKVIEVGKQYGKYLNTSRLNLISEQSQVSVPVALGMLQHFGLLDWRQFAKYKEHVKEFIPSELVRG